METEVRRKIALTVIRSRLRIEINTGMNFRESTVNAARSWGYTGNRTRKAALEWVNEELGD